MQPVHLHGTRPTAVELSEYNMYNGYVQCNKFNLRGGRPVQNRFPDGADDKGPVQRQPDESILLHNRKREIEVRLLDEADKLSEQG